MFNYLPIEEEQEQEQELQLEAGLVIENKLTFPHPDLTSDSVTPPPSESSAWDLVKLREIDRQKNDHYTPQIYILFIYVSKTLLQIVD